MTTHDLLMNLKHFIINKLELFLFYMLKNSYLCTMNKNLSMIMRKFIRFILAALLLPMTAMAANTTLVVELTNGQTANYLLQDKPVLTMEGSQLTIKTGTVQTSYERSLVKCFFFTGESSGVKEMLKGTLVYKQTDADHLEISGLSQSDRIAIYNTSGVQVGSVSRDSDKAVVSLSGLQRGIYLVKIGERQTIKFVRK